jgi:NhaA family Na+:H+ antiporter
MTSPPRRRHFSVLRDFLDNEASGGLLLMAAAAVALVVANSPAAPAYFSLLHAPLAGLDVLHWINDGLMAVFFLLIGLEIKREFLDGELSSWSRRVLPGVAAVGGMVVPALIYVAFNMGDPVTLRGWAIPAATDIAFALGILSLLGPRVPASLKIFLAALAILDDLGAIVIIAVFYTAELSVTALGLAALSLAILIAFNRFGIARLWPYLIVGAALALTIPLRASPARPDDPESPLHRLEHGISPWVAFGVVPVFGFANAGVSFAGVDASVLMGPVPLGIALGLFVGKQIGVFGACWLAIRTDIADLPAGASWSQLYGVGLLCGIGFTMSLFIGALAFPQVPELVDAVKIGVLGGSVLSAIGGWLVLRVARREALDYRKEAPARH